MRAVTIEQFGATPKLTTRPVPEPGPGQVRITVEAASVNPLDAAIASGSLSALGAYRFPLTLGMDGAGTVTATGDGVTEFAIGDRVFGQFWGRPLQFGTFAEVAVVQAAPALGALAAVPDGLHSHVAAAMPTSGMTALGAIDHLRVPDHGTLLVLGATGGVGTYAVQIAAAQGIRVIATASARLADGIRKLGAADIAVRGEEPVDQVLRRLAPDGVDAILDAVGDRTANARVAGAVRDGGALFSTAFGLDEHLLAQQRIRTANYRLDRKPERLAGLADLVTAGTVQPVIGSLLPLTEAPRALAGDITPSGLRGKTVLQIA
ncbi:NADP-dependent oxidoreductase [Streptomyces sp. NPDC001508]|uniref:NADP-dependent oxidoreductase n=1 Tax=Streptomyces sp. NPDC001508 TaxID=3154656 RepID=UPI00332D25F4